jgi:hypothetical protein
VWEEGGNDIQEGVSTTGTSGKPLKDGNSKKGCFFSLKAHLRTKKGGMIRKRLFCGIRR